MYATQTVIRQCVEPGMLVMHKGKPWRAAVNKNGKLHIHQLSERTSISGYIFDIILDWNNEPVKEAS